MAEPLMEKFLESSYFSGGNAAYIETPGCKPFLVVAFSVGPERAADESVLPELTQRLIQASAPS